MDLSSRITRGILIGGAVGAFSVSFGIVDNLFISVGVGAISGFLAGITLSRLDKKRKK